MAMEMGITAGAYAKIERGETDPSVTRVLQIAQILEVDVAVLFKDTDTGQLVANIPIAPYVTRSELNAVIDALNHLKAEIEIIRKQLPAI